MHRFGDLSIFLAVVLEIWMYGRGLLTLDDLDSDFSLEGATELYLDMFGLDLPSPYA